MSSEQKNCKHFDISNLKRLQVELHKFAYSIIAILSIIGMTMSHVTAESFRDDFSGFLRHRLRFSEINDASPFNRDNRMDIEETENQTTVNIDYKHRWRLFKLHIDVEEDYKYNEDDPQWTTNALYIGTIIPSLRLNAAIGRQKIVFGTGLFVNPTETFDVDKDPFDLAEDRLGIDALKLSFFLGNINLMYVMQYDDEYKDNILHHGRISLTYHNTDIGLTFSTKMNGKNVFGMTASKYVTNELEFHFEIAGQQGRDNPVPKETNSDIFTYVNEEKNVLINGVCGIRHFHDEYHLTTVLEYYYNGIGLSHSHYRTILDGLAIINNRALPVHSDLEFVEKTKTLIEEQYVQQHYLLVGIQKGYRLGTITLQLDGVLSVADKSGAIAPKAKFLFKEHFLLSAQWIWVYGGNDTEFGTRPIDGIALFEIKYLF